jgi:hypothetical protein
MDIKLKRELAKEIRNGNYEMSENGVYFPAAHLLLGGRFGNQVIRDGHPSEWNYSDNIVVNQGLDHVLSITLGAGTQITSWFVAIFSGNYTPLATDNASNIASNSTEATGYSEATRIAYVPDAVSAQNIQNATTTADFSITSSFTVFGAFLVSASAKNAVTGTLMAASRFAASRAVVNLDTLRVTYGLTAADA